LVFQDDEIHETFETRLEQIYEIDTILFASISLPYFEIPSLNAPSNPGPKQS
jgi:hypothetical protein